MKCENCGAFFVRYPCPTCSVEENKISEGDDEKTEDNALVRPSELKGRSAVNPNYKIDSDNGKTSTQILAEKAGQKIDDSYLIEQRGSLLPGSIDEFHSQIQKGDDYPDKKIEDEEYRTRIRKTLIEVRDAQMKLLRLIEMLIDEI